MDRPAVRGCLLALHVQAVVAHDRGNAQPIVAEDAGASRRLGGSMRRALTPASNGLLVAPERQREEIVGIREARKPLHRDEPVHALELALELRGKLQVVALAAIGRPDLEDDCDHASAPLPKLMIHRRWIAGNCCQLSARLASAAPSVSDLRFAQTM